MFFREFRMRWRGGSRAFQMPQFRLTPSCWWAVCSSPIFCWPNWIATRANSTSVSSIFIDTSGFFFVHSNIHLVDYVTCFTLQIDASVRHCSRIRRYVDRVHGDGAQLVQRSIICLRMSHQLVVASPLQWVLFIHSHHLFVAETKWVLIKLQSTISSRPTSTSRWVFLYSICQRIVLNSCFSTGTSVHGTDVVPGTGHAAVHPLAAVHLHAVASQKYRPGTTCFRLSRHDRCQLRHLCRVRFDADHHAHPNVRSFTLASLQFGYKMLNEIIMQIRYAGNGIGCWLLLH